MAESRRFDSKQNVSLRVHFATLSRRQGHRRDKVVIVTVVRHRIGAATAQRSLQQGASVVLSGWREHKFRETLIGLDTSKALVHAGDVSEETHVKRLINASVKKLGKLDVLVNNAGFADSVPSNR